MSPFSQLIKDLENNFKTDISSTAINFNLSNVKVKLYNTIDDACLENANHEWYDFDDVARLNNKSNRPTGIIMHNCTNNKCVVSIIIDDHPNYRYFVLNNLEVKTI
jgi:hypothetical protein